MLGDCEEPLTFVLVHGAWHTGRVWDGVAEHLSAAGHVVHAPTLAGHGDDVDPSVTLDQVADSLIEYIETENLYHVTLLGWSFGGLPVSLAAPRLPDRVTRVVFHSAFVLRPGQSLYDALPPTMSAYFRSLTRDGTVKLPFDTFRNRFAQNASATRARHIHDEHLSPQVVAMMDTPVDTAPFHRLVSDGSLKASYIHAPEDIALPTGRWGWYPRFAQRLGNGTPRVTWLSGADHESALTAPAATAQAFVHAARD